MNNKAVKLYIVFSCFYVSELFAYCTDDAGCLSPDAAICASNTCIANCPDGTKHNSCSADLDCAKWIPVNGQYKRKCGKNNTEALEWRCIAIKEYYDNTNYTGRACFPPPKTNQSGSWREDLSGVITNNLIKTAKDIVDYTFDAWVESLTDSHIFITGNYTFADKYYKSFCYGVLGCEEENAFDFIDDNYRFNINYAFAQKNKVIPYQLPYDLLTYSLFSNNIFANAGVRLGAEQMANNLIFDKDLDQLSVTKAKDLLALLLNDIDSYMRFYRSVFTESLVLETTSNAYAQRIPYKIQPLVETNYKSNDKKKVSLLSVLEDESTRRFTNLEWRTEINKSSKLALYRELAIIFSHRLMMSYRKDALLTKISLYRVNSFFEEIKEQEVIKQLNVLGNQTRK